MSEVRTAESLAVDALDQRIVRCLQLRPRATFSVLATVLEVSEQTVARRYRRMHRQGVVRVIGVVDPSALGQSNWIVRVRCRPDGTLDVGRALSRREDVSWVSVSAGGSELVCAVRSRSAEDRDRLLLERLPRTGAVLEVSAAVIMRQFAGGSNTDWLRADGALTDEQAAALGADAPAATATPGDTELDAGDEAMLEVLARDGRATYAELARAARTTEGRATRRLAALLESGVVYLDVDLAGVALGFPISAYVWLSVLPSHLQQACEALATHSEAPFVAAVTGRANAVASVMCRDLDELYAYATDRVGVISGVTAIEIAPVVLRLKQAGTRVDGGRLAGI